MKAKVNLLESVFWCLSLLHINFLGCQVFGENTDYFPIEEGNYWVYTIKRPGLKGDDLSWTVIKAGPVEADLQLGNLKVRVIKKQDRVLVHMPGEGFEVWYLFSVGTTWEQRSPFICDDHSMVTVEAEEKPVRTPAGVFSNCLKLTHASMPCMDAGTAVEWWAPGVGRVKAIETSIAGPVEILLKDYCLEGQACKEKAFKRGDANADGSLDLADAIFTLGFLFRGQGEPLCKDSLDSNDDGRLDLADPISIIGYIFLGTGPLPDPFSFCGVDPTKDRLGCQSFPPCEKVSCQEAARSIAEESSIVGSCSAVVRLRYKDKSIIGWELFCGRYNRVKEKEAREKVLEDSSIVPGRLISNPKEEGLYIFLSPAHDFGSAAVVSARTGLSVFAGTIVWDGVGEISYPKSWRSAEELAKDCMPIDLRIPRSGYNLSSGDPLPEDEVESALGKVWRTALPAGLARAGYLFEAVVLLYPPTVGAFDPDKAEWIVILNSGWLE